jgi:DNA adenine methylase
MDRFKTPLRYPGGKSAFYSFIASILRQNSLVDGFYVEAFCGGAGLAFELLLREYVQHIYLNDADPHIFSFWYSLLNETKNFIKLIEDAKVTVKEWGLQKSIYDSPNSHSCIEVGFATFFLNRCNRSGILGGRPIGGLNQAGQWKIGARFNKKSLIRRIELISFYTDRIHIYGCDAVDFLGTLIKSLPQDKTLVYLDPPYYTGEKKLYFNYYDHTDHESLSKFIQCLPVKWILSYNDVPQVMQMYRGKRSIDISLFYRANKLKRGKELIIFSDDLQLAEANQAIA